VPLLRDFLTPDADFVPEEPLRAPLERLDPEPEDLARVDEDLLDPLDLRPPDFAFEPDERDADVLREPLLARDEEERLELPELALALPSIVHLPDITRCAASATASAISEPSLVAL
jgi:hypothetical protein